MKRGTKILLLILMVPVILFGGLIIYLKCAATHYDNQLLELAAQVKPGMTTAQVEQILSFDYKIYTEQTDVKEWEDNQWTIFPASDEISRACHLYVFFCSSEYKHLSADCIFVYIDPQTQTVKHVALQYW